MIDMTVKEYNTKYLPKIRHAQSFIGCLDHAMEKTGAYEEAMHQLSCIGWGDDVRKTINTALVFYKDHCVRAAKLHDRDAWSGEMEGLSDGIYDLIFSPSLSDQEASQLICLLRKAQGVCSTENNFGEVR